MNAPGGRTRTKADPASNGHGDAHQVFKSDRGRGLQTAGIGENGVHAPGSSCRADRDFSSSLPKSIFESMFDWNGFV